MEWTYIHHMFFIYKYVHVCICIHMYPLTMRVYAYVWSFDCQTSRRDLKPLHQGFCLVMHGVLTKEAVAGQNSQQVMLDPSLVKEI